MSDDFESKLRESWDRLLPITQMRLDKAIRKLFTMHNRRLNDEVVLEYCMHLAPYASGKLIWEALAEARSDDRFPNLAALKRRLAGRPETEEYKAPPLLTEAERKRADHAAILSMLWLHCSAGWDLRDFAGHTLGRLFERDPTEALEAAKQIYNRATVLRWMEDQRAAGN